MSNRRAFIKQSGTAAIGIAISGSVLTACSLTAKTQKVSKQADNTGFDQQPLPYAYTALEPYIDAQTMEIHYTKHAGAYSKNLKEAAQAEGVTTGTSVETILAGISRYSAKMRNNGGGHYNHELFWKCMTPPTQSGMAQPKDSLLAAIEKTFNSFDVFKNQFTEAAKTRFGSGWAWLVVNPAGNLQICSTANQDNPLMDIADIKGYPLLGLDVWEHAYYLKYQNKRADYIDNFWKLINWNFVQQRFNNR